MVTYSPDLIDQPYSSDPNVSQVFDRYKSDQPAPAGGRRLALVFLITGFTATSKPSTLDGTGVKSLRLAHKLLSAGFDVALCLATTNSATSDADPANPRCWYPPTVTPTDPWIAEGFDYAEKDALRAVHWVKHLIATNDAEFLQYRADQIVVAGDSAGADAALATLHQNFGGGGYASWPYAESTRGDIVLALEPQTFWRAFVAATTTGLAQVGHFQQAGGFNPPTPATSLANAASNHADTASFARFAWHDAVYPGVSALNAVAPIWLGYTTDPGYAGGYGSPGPGIWNGANNYPTEVLDASVTFHHAWFGGLAFEIIKACATANSLTHKSRFATLVNAAALGNQSATFATDDELLDDAVQFALDNTIALEPVEERIIQNVVDTLAAIAVGSEFYNTVAKVVRDEDESAASEYPIVFVFDQGTLEDTNSTALTDAGTFVLRLEVIGVDVLGDDKHRAMKRLAADIQGALVADQSRGGLAVWTRVTGRNPSLATNSEQVFQVSLDVEIFFRTQFDDATVAV